MLIIYIYVSIHLLSRWEKLPTSRIFCYQKIFYRKKGIDVFHINRGGDVTFHGPGQLTGYPILDLEFFSSDLKVYMRMLEEVMILTIANYGIDGYRIADATGVWVNSKNR
jgi:lipoate-protein ligase B